MIKKSKFDILFESAISSTPESYISEANFAKKRKPLKKKPKRRKKSEVDKKIKKANKPKPIDQERHDMQQSRGANRKKQDFIPAYHRIKHDSGIATSRKVLNIAKKASSGIWKLTPMQIVELAAKYKFNVPGPTKTTKHLGSTGILMWRKNRKDYYLVKLGKHTSI